MLNLSKNGMKLLSTHSVVGIEPVWIFSQIFIQSVKLTKILTCLIYRVYPIPLIVFFPSKKSSAAVAFLLFIIIITMVYIYRNASKCYVAEFTEICQTFEMHQYIFISIIYWKNKQQCNQLLSNSKTNSSAQPVST